MKSIFALALGLTLMAGPSFADPGNGDGGGNAYAYGLNRDVQEAPLSEGGLAALMILGAMAGLLVVQRQRS